MADGGIEQSGGTVALDAQDEARGITLAMKAVVERPEDYGGITGEGSGSAHGPDKERGQHAGLHSFASQVANEDQGAAVFGIGNDLEEFAAYFAGWTRLRIRLRPASH